MVLTFTEKCEKWFNSKKPMVKPSTLYIYHNRLYGCILPFFNGKEVTNLTVQNYILHLTKNNFSNRTIRDAVMLVRAIASIDSTKKIVFEVEYPTILKSRKKPSRSFSKKEIKKLRKYVFNNSKTDKYCLGVLLSLSLGLRIGETTALQYSDFNFRTNQVEISKTSQRINVINSDNKKTHTKIIIGPPKTQKSNRKLPVPQDVLQIVKEYMLLNDPEDYIFLNKKNGKLLDTRVLRINFNKILKILKLPKINYHALRHTFATICISSGIDAKTTSSLLGHSNVKTTLELYTHPSFEQKKKAVNKLSSLF